MRLQQPVHFHDPSYTAAAATSAASCPQLMFAPLDAGTDSWSFDNGTGDGSRSLYCLTYIVEL